MKEIKQFDSFLNEGKKNKKIDKKFISALDDYKNYIISNITIKNGKVDYSDFDNIDVKLICKELNKKFSKEIVLYFNTESFLRKISQILELKSKRAKERIENEFNEYYTTLKERYDKFFSKEKKRDKKTENEVDKIDNEKSLITRSIYEDEKYDLQIELVKLQEWVKKNGKKIAIVFEGRDSAGKGSTIKRFIESLNPRIYRIVALGMPTEYEKKNWFKRYEKEMPNEGEIVFFDRSWHNRSIVEPAMDYCTEKQYIDFMSKVNDWEKSLIEDSGIILIKLWFSITKVKQLQRFELRKKSPIKFWKFSPNDEKVVDKWDIITKYKNQMFENNSTDLSPWVIINSNDKKVGRLNAIRYVLSVISYDGKYPEVCEYYPEVVTILK